MSALQARLLLIVCALEWTLCTAADLGQLPSSGLRPLRRTVLDTSQHFALGDTFRVRVSTRTRESRDSDANSAAGYPRFTESQATSGSGVGDKNVYMDGVIELDGAPLAAGAQGMTFKARGSGQDANNLNNGLNKMGAAAADRAAWVASRQADAGAAGRDRTHDVKLTPGTLSALLQGVLDAARNFQVNLNGPWPFVLKTALPGAAPINIAALEWERHNNECLAAALPLADYRNTIAPYLGHFTARCIAEDAHHRLVDAGGACTYLIFARFGTRFEGFPHAHAAVDPTNAGQAQAAATRATTLFLNYLHSLSVLWNAGFTHGDAHEKNTMYDPATNAVKFIDLPYVNIFPSTAHAAVAACDWTRERSEKLRMYMEFNGLLHGNWNHHVNRDSDLYKVTQRICDRLQNGGGGMQPLQNQVWQASCIRHVCPPLRAMAAGLPDLIVDVGAQTTAQIRTAIARMRVNVFGQNIDLAANGAANQLRAHGCY